MIDDLQDLIGENVWSAEDSVIGYQEFRENTQPSGMEEFTELFKFFVHFRKKSDYEVKQTEMALGQLCNALERTFVGLGPRGKISASGMVARAALCFPAMRFQRPPDRPSPKDLVPRIA